jgi:hypothetical protein
LRLRSDVDLFCDLYRVVDLNAEISNGAFNLRVPEQELACSQIASALVDQHRLGAT